MCVRKYIVNPEMIKFAYCAKFANISVHVTPVCSNASNNYKTSFKKFCNFATKKKPVTWSANILIKICRSSKRCFFLFVLFLPMRFGFKIFVCDKCQICTYSLKQDNIERIVNKDGFQILITGRAWRSDTVYIVI